MPKVGYIRLRYNSENSIRHDIFYNSKNKFHIKDLPDEFIGLTKFTAHGYETENLLEDAARSACEVYRQLKSNSKTIILYRCSASPELTSNKIGIDSWEGLLKGVSPKIHHVNNGVACFEVNFILIQVVSDGVQKKYYKIDPETKKVERWEFLYADSYQSMDYTEERWQFFLSIVEGMKKMVVQASQFFGAEPEQAAEFIESKMKLLNP